MARIFNGMGMSVGAINRAFGNSESGSGLVQDENTGVDYIEINHGDMTMFEDFYKRDETDVANANDMKNFYSLNNSVEYSFAGEQLDEEKYALRQPLNALLSEARAWHDMYGFVAVYNPDIRADFRVRELRALGTVDNNSRNGNAQTGRATTSALDMPEFFLAEANALIDNVMSPNESATRSAIFGDDLVPPSQRRRGGKRARSDDEGVVDARRTVSRIVNNPRYSNLRNPGAVLQTEFIERPGATGDEFNSDAFATTLSAEDTRRRLASLEQRRDPRRTLDETVIGLRRLQIVNLQDGRFFLEIDRASMTRRVVFVRNYGGARPVGSAPSSDGANDFISNGQPLMIDPDVFVYVWDNRMPFDDGKLNSKFYEVVRRRSALDQADRNAADVDLTNSHPTQWLEHVPVSNKLDSERLLDSQLFSRGASQTSVETIEQLKRDAVLDYRLRMSAAVQNQKNVEEWAVMVHQGKISKTALDNKGALVYPEFRKLGLQPLPSGFKMAQASKAELTIDIEMLIFRFRRALSNALGVPLAILDSGSSFSGRASKNSSGSSSSGASQATQAISDSRLRNSILADRKILRAFVTNMWDIQYRQIDNETLAYVLEKAANRSRSETEVRLAEMRLIRKRLQTITDTSVLTQMRSTLTSRRDEIQASVARLRELSTRVRQIVSMEYRFTIEFKSLSFIPLAELQAGVQSFAISKLEYANAQRANFGMLPLTQEELDANEKVELDKHVDTMEAEAQVQAKYAPKPGPNGTGGAKQLKIPSATGGKTPKK